MRVLVCNHTAAVALIYWQYAVFIMCLFLQMVISYGQTQEPQSLKAQGHKLKEKKQAMKQKRRAVMMRRTITTRSTSSRIVYCCDKVMLSYGKRNRLDPFLMRRRLNLVLLYFQAVFPIFMKDLLPATDKQALNYVQYHNMQKCVNVFRCYDCI